MAYSRVRGFIWWWKTLPKKAVFLIQEQVRTSAGQAVWSIRARRNVKKTAIRVAQQRARLNPNSLWRVLCPADNQIHWHSPLPYLVFRSPIAQRDCKQFVGKVFADCPRDAEQIAQDKHGEEGWFMVAYNPAELE